MQKKLKKFFTLGLKVIKSKEFIRFFIIGISTFILDFTLLQIFLRVFGVPAEDHLKETIVNIGSSIIAIIVNYILQRTWAFESKTKNIVKESGKFFLVQGLNLIIFQTLLFSLVNYFLTPGISKVFVTGVQIAFSFVMYKFFVFKPKNISEEGIDVSTGLV